MVVEWIGEDPVAEKPKPSSRQKLSAASRRELQKIAEESNRNMTLGIFPKQVDPDDVIPTDPQKPIRPPEPIYNMEATEELEDEWEFPTEELDITSPPDQRSCGGVFVDEFGKSLSEGTL